MMQRCEENMKYFEHEQYNAIEIVELQNSYVWKELMSKTKESIKFSYTCNQDEKKYIEKLWNSLVPAIADESKHTCHYPYYALRLVQNSEVVAVAALCWQCDTLSISSNYFSNRMITFNATTDEAQKLFQLCRKITSLEIKKAIKKRDKKILNDLFYSMNESIEDYFEILLSMLNENWHDFHRDIVFELQRLKNPKAIEALYTLVATKKEKGWIYHQSIWALADIGTEASKEKLLMLSTSKYKEVAFLAQKRLDEWDNELTRKSLEVGCRKVTLYSI